MKNLKKIHWFACLLIILGSCRKHEDLNLQTPFGLGGDAIAPTAIDKWIQDSLTRPYNIAVKYRWDPWWDATDDGLKKLVTPVAEERIIPLFSALKKVWINPYNDETGSDLFMKKYAPKQLELIGSVEYLVGNLVYLGQADQGGNNIVFFDINQNYFKDPVFSFRRIIQTVHHEFGHILHRTVQYPQDFVGTSSKLGLAGYSAATWFNVSNEEALANGYASNYSMSGPDDDFVEMVSIMLTEGKSRWDEIKGSTNATAREALQQKENYVVTYYRQVWNIDFYRLQTRVQAALTVLFPVPAVLDEYGIDKTYSTASVNPANTALLPQPAPFTAIFNAAKSGLAATVSNGTSGRVLDSFAVAHYSVNSVLLLCYFHTAANPTIASEAIYLYNYTLDANNVFTFFLAGSDANGATFATALAPLVNYFSNNRFALSWYANPRITIYPRVKFTPQNTPGTYFISWLLP